MESLNLDGLPDQALLLIDSQSIIYVLQGRAKLAERFLPLFAAHAAGSVLFATTTITVAEVLTGPLQAGDEEVSREKSRSWGMSASLVQMGRPY
jgi:hypothetical protein